MKTFCLFLVALACRYSSGERDEEDLEQIIEEVEAVAGGLDLVGYLDGVGRSDADPLSSLKQALRSSGDYGVVVDVQNYSGLKLTDPTLHLDYGQGRRYGTVRGHGLEHTQREAFVFHDKLGDGSVWTATRGVISWLIEKPDGSYYVDNDHHQKPLQRLWLYWDTCWSGKNHVTVGFYRNVHVENKLPTREYSRYFENAARAKNNGLSLQKHKGVIGLATIEPRQCTKVVVLTLQIGSKKHRSPKTVTQMASLTEGLKAAKLIGKDTSVWSYFAIGIGFLGVIVLTCFVFTTIKGRMRRSSGREARQYRGDKGNNYHQVKQTLDKEDLVPSNKGPAAEFKDFPEKEDLGKV